MDDYNTQLFRGKTLFPNNNDRCYKFYVQNGNVCCEEVRDFYCSREEADTQMFFHLTNQCAGTK